LELEDVPAKELKSGDWIKAWQKALSSYLAENRISYLADAHALRTFAQLFAEEEMRRFMPISLLSWRRKSHYAHNLTALDDLSEPTNQTAWGDLMLNFAPFFSLSQSPAVFGTDLLARFIKDNIARLAQMRIDTAAGLEEARHEFRHQVQIHRTSLPGNFLPNFILLVEGATEVILLPRLAALLDFNFSRVGAMVVPAGGANQVAKEYLYLKEVLRLPIFVVLDNDAEEQNEILQNSMRGDDRIHVLADGEMEDILTNDVFISLLNKFIESLSGMAPGTSNVRDEEFTQGVPRKRALSRLWKERNLGKFDKVGFAKFIVEELAPTKSAGNGLSPDGVALIKSICSPGVWNQRFYNGV